MAIAQDIINGVNALFGDYDKKTIDGEIIKNARILAASTETKTKDTQNSEIYQFSDKSELVMINNEIYEKY